MSRLSRYPSDLTDDQWGAGQAVRAGRHRPAAGGRSMRDALCWTRSCTRRVPCMRWAPAAAAAAARGLSPWQTMYWYFVRGPPPGWICRSPCPVEAGHARALVEFRRGLDLTQATPTMSLASTRLKNDHESVLVRG
jgi:hypothetical protein